MCKKSRGEKDFKVFCTYVFVFNNISENWYLLKEQEQNFRVGLTHGTQAS